MSGPVSLLWRIRSDNSYFNICFDSPCRRLISSRTNTDAVIGEWFKRQGVGRPIPEPKGGSRPLRENLWDEN